MKKLLLIFTLLFTSQVFAQCVTINGCPANIVVNADSASCNAVVSFTAPTSVYSCTVTPITVTYNYTGSLQTFTVPAGVTSINIDATGAQGGSINVSCTATGGLGARMIGDVAVTPGEVITILVGQQGFTNGSDAGGGGGSFVVRAGNIPLVVAGGGGGASNNIGSCGSNLNGIDATITTSGTASGNGVVAGGTGGNGGGASNGSGGGGGGFLTDGVAGAGLANNNGKSYLNGGAGGTGNNNDFGGYGGGGAGWFTGGNGGGGGGYSGGGTSGSQPFTGGGGGGSYNIGTNQINTAGYQTGNGRVIITYSVDTNTYVNLISGLPSGSAFPIGVTNQLYVATDSAGSFDTCVFTITVNDVTNPVADPVLSISTGADSATCMAVVSFADATFTDCSSLTVVQSSGLPSGSNFPVGTSMIEFTATDAAGNSSTSSFNIIVNDVTEPLISCAGNVISCSQIVTGISATASDNCAGSVAVDYVLTGATTGAGTGSANGTSFNVGVTTVTYTASDVAGNTSSCSMDVTILDCSGIEDDEPLSLVQLYPNPNSGFVNLDLGATYQNVEIKIANMNGQILSNRNFNNTSVLNISTTDLAAGVYVVYINADGINKAVRMIRN